MIVKPSREGFCLSEKHCFPLNAKGPDAKRRKKAWLASHRLYTGRIGTEVRGFALVGIKQGKRITAHFADCITGTFYSARTHHAASSPLRIDGLRRDQKESSDLLINWTPAWSDEE